MKRLAVALAFLAALPAAAHQQAISTSEMVARGDRVEVRLRFATADLADLVQFEGGAKSPLTQAEMDRILPALAHLTLDGLSLATPEGRCVREEGARGEPDGPDGLSIEGAFRCPAPPQSLRV